MGSNLGGLRERREMRVKNKDCEGVTLRKISGFPVRSAKISGFRGVVVRSSGCVVEVRFENGFFQAHLASATKIGRRLTLFARFAKSTTETVDVLRTLPPKRRRSTDFW